MSKGRILFQLSGSIACYKACHVISRLVQAGHEVEVTATPAALKFVGPTTLEGLTGKPVHSDVFAHGGCMDHIRLARWADLTILCPGTANTVNKLASGAADDLLSTLFLAHDFKKPYLIAPAMNTMMLRHPATQASLAKLKQWGIEVLETDSGPLACGETGEGRLLDPERIYQAIESRLRAPIEVRTNEQVFEPSQSRASHDLGLSILITSGGTSEPLDGVRAITNFSTGNTGAAMADYFSKRGDRVTLLRAESSARPESNAVSCKTFVTFRDLEQTLRFELSKTPLDAVIHLAAVGDYSVNAIESDGRPVEATEKGKIDSTNGITIHLKQNPKLVDHLREYSCNKNILVVAFKLTNTAAPAERLKAVRSLASHARPDFIVHNDLSGIESAQNKHRFTLFSVDDKGELQTLNEVETKADLAAALERILAAKTAKEMSK